MMRLQMALAVTMVAASVGHGQPAPPTSDPVVFRAVGEDAPRLEGVRSIPRRASASLRVPAVVLCHPHPLMGGTMNDPVLLEVEEGLLGLGIAVLRFNFRGTGESEGEHGAGETEVDDVLGAVAFLRAQPTVDADRVALAGYSFGAQMALKTLARDESLAAGACIGFPTGLELVRAADYPHLADVAQPLLFVTGTEDEYSSIPNIMALREHYGLEARVLPIQNTGHFFPDAGLRSMMGRQVAQFLSMKLFGEL